METYRLRPGTPAILPFDGGEATLLVFQTPYGKGWVDHLRGGRRTRPLV